METNSALQNYAAELIPAYNGRVTKRASELKISVRKRQMKKICEVSSPLYVGSLHIRHVKEWIEMILLLFFRHNLSLIKCSFWLPRALFALKSFWLHSCEEQRPYDLHGNCNLPSPPGSEMCAIPLPDIDFFQRNPFLLRILEIKGKVTLHSCKWVGGYDYFTSSKLT